MHAGELAEPRGAAVVLQRKVDSGGATAHAAAARQAPSDFDEATLASRRAELAQLTAIATRSRAVPLLADLKRRRTRRGAARGERSRGQRSRGQRGGQRSYRPSRHRPSGSSSAQSSAVSAAIRLDSNQRSLIMEQGTSRVSRTQRP